MTKGTVYLVGAGPGDPKLLTLRGHDLLQQAEVVVYDHLVAPSLLKVCPPTAKLVYVGKEATRHTLTQEQINQLLIRSAKSGKRVVRLKGGDPFLFGRGGEEAQALAKARVPYEVVPGVSSALAVPAYAGIPVTHRALSSSVAILTGHEDPAKPESAIRWDRVATACDTLIFLMGVSTLAGIVSQLTRHGRLAKTPCAVIEWGTRPRQRTVAGTLATIVARTKRAVIAPPAVLVVGDVVRLRSELNWFERRPLFGARVLVTRPADKASSLAEQLEALGADVAELPAIALAPVRPNGALRSAVNSIPKTDWVFFTSPEGIGWFSRMLKPYRKDVRWLSGCHIGAIGPKTAASIEQAGLHVDFVPKRFSQEGLLEDLPRRVLRGKRALILSAQESRDVLADGLRRRGMAVTKVPIYRTVLPSALTDGLKTFFQKPFDLVTVTSASCADHLHQALQTAGRAQVFRRLRFASIGPVTSAAVRAFGGHVAVEAKVSTIEGLIEAILQQSGRR
ncbi:MAG: uroporphyrinogen-III C-methyltransferase [Candidatus Omnitrophica bacterium]|nr:uroporphyrinogen-III C-methyltransferase [Candidatus Omnitrophota bacterium]